jgi:RNA polymerase sigma-70 factor (ECF subfamily)
MFARPQAVLRRALVNGAAGIVVEIAGRVVAVMAFTVVAGRIVAIDALNDPGRLARLDLSALD